jgi:hypothetical protein
MRIENLRTERRGRTVLRVATVIWEDSDRPTRDIYYEVDEAFASYLSCDQHASLVGSIVPAMRHGEKRIAVEEPICPELRKGLATAMGWLCHWYGSPRRPVRIETKPVVSRPWPGSSRRTGSFLSGGVDSLATLRLNRCDFPLDHPSAIKDCLVVHGFDIGGQERSGTEMDAFRRALAALSAVAEDAKVTLIPVSTNIRHLDDDVNFWIYEFHGAALASVAHALCGRFTTVHIASTFDIPNLQAWGSHPLLDPNYSSFALQIKHDGARFSRLDKVRLIADWPVALQNLRVCTENPPGLLNCGKCEKCIRTMLELQVAGALAQTDVFPAKMVTKELLETLVITDAYEESCCRDLIVPLRQQGSSALAEIIERRSVEYNKRLAWEQERDWKGAIKRFDRQHLSGSLYGSYRSLRAHARIQS